MGEVLDQRDRLTEVSISRLAAGFRMARETVSKKLAEANIQPVGKRDGYPVYPLREAAEAILGTASFDEDGNADPRKLAPEKRKAWYQSEISRLQVETNTRQLIPAGEVEAEFADLIKSLVQYLDTLGDQLERDCGLTPEQVERVNETVTSLRAQWYAKLIQDDAVATAERTGQ